MSTDFISYAETYYIKLLPCIFPPCFSNGYQKDYKTIEMVINNEESTDVGPRNEKIQYVWPTNHNLSRA